METGERKSAAISELPLDELILYGQKLGLALDAKMGQGELLRRVRERQELLINLDREAMLDIVIWARRPVRRSASKEELAKEIATIKRMNTRGLSYRGVATLAKLRGIAVADSEPADAIEARMRAAEPMADWINRGRRKLLGKLIGKMMGGDDLQQGETYQFLPEEQRPPTLKQQIADEGVVGGLARRIRGVADDYVQEKLDEIEKRIDRKLDEIDQRLAEWRDQEITNRLRIIKITLVASVLVALLSLGYSYVRYWAVH